MDEKVIPPSRMPERFVLEKETLHKVFAGVRKHWARDELTTGQNVIFNSALVTVITTIDIPFVSITTLKNIYFAVIEAVRQIETLNTLKISMDEAKDPKIKKSFQQLYDILLEKIEKGSAFTK